MPNLIAIRSMGAELICTDRRIDGNAEVNRRFSRLREKRLKVYKIKFKKFIALM
jgi:hypothetical protein